MFLAPISAKVAPKVEKTAAKVEKAAEKVEKAAEKKAKAVEGYLRRDALNATEPHIDRPVPPEQYLSPCAPIGLSGSFSIIV